MLQRLTKNWQELREQPQLLIIGSGLLVIAVGVFFLPAPGPGSVVIVIGAGLLAQESLVVARALDWTEVQLRRVTSWGLRSWKEASLPVKIALIVSGALLACAAGFGAYQVVEAR